MGLPIFELKEVDKIEEGDVIRVDMAKGEIINITQAERYKFRPIPKFMQKLVDAGGLINFAKQEIANDKVIYSQLSHPKG
jgi:3-isopropylmalate/(R)-2-methylmalate dehydratase small subunit